MLDFTSIRNNTKTYRDLIQELTPDDLHNLTNEMIDLQLSILIEGIDGDVVFVPEDPEADDPFAISEEEINMPWTLGHVIVHVTASSEESAFLSAELARGVPYRSGRSRYEVPWQSMKTIAQCRDRLEESRRIRLGCLDVWPDDPHLDNTYDTSAGLRVNPILRFVFGLSHDDSHLDQMRDILKQAKISRTNISTS